MTTVLIILAIVVGLAVVVLFGFGSGKSELGRLNTTADRERRLGEKFAMTVEDVFSIKGRGTVVTGKVRSGSIHVGDTIALLRGAERRRVEVTGIEMFRKITEEAAAGDNVGLLLAGVDRDQVKPGDILERD